jgi:hypothetical protein
MCIDQSCTRGCVEVCHERGIFVVDNVTSGYELYGLEEAEFLRSYATTVEKQVIRGVAFGEDSRVVVGGSDKGLVYVFDRQTGVVLDTLPHAKRGLVQTIAVRDRQQKWQASDRFIDLGKQNQVRICSGIIGGKGGG